MVMVSDHEQRVFEAILNGHVRPAKIIKCTCLSSEHVKKALSKLRRERKVEFVDGEYSISRSSDG